MHRPFVAYHTPYISDEQRRAVLENLREYVRSLDDQPNFAMPDLDDFDAVFARKPAEKAR